MEPHTLTSWLRHIATVTHRQTDQTLQEHLGIGMAQINLLTVLQDHTAVQQRFLAESLGHTEAGISRQVALLAAKDLLTKQVNPRRKREHIITLTVKGAKLTRAAAEIVNREQNRLFEELSGKERQNLAETLQYIHSQCCQTNKPHACSIPWFTPPA